MATITPKGIRVEISYDTLVASAIALISRAEMFAEGDFTKEFALERIAEIQRAVRELGWESTTVEELYAKIEAE